MNSHNISFLNSLSSFTFFTFIKLLVRESFFSSSLFNLKSHSREFFFSSQLSFIEISNDEESIIEFSNDDEFESFQFMSRASLTSQFTFRASLTFQFTSRAFDTFFVSFFELQKVSTQMKTTYIINEMRKIKFFFNDMLKKMMISNSHSITKNKFLSKLQSSKKQFILSEMIDDFTKNANKHRAELASLIRHALFQA